MLSLTNTLKTIGLFPKMSELDEDTTLMVATVNRELA